MHAWIIVLTLALGTAVSNGFARFGYGLILPAMQADLGWSYTMAGWINTANAAGYLVGALLALYSSNLLGPLRLFRYGMITTTVALLLSGFTADFSTLFVLRLLAGIGGAPVFISGGVMVATMFASDSSKNTLAIALYFGGSGFGILITAILLPPIMEVWSVGAWPHAWKVLGGLCLISLVPAWWGTKQLSDAPKTDGDRFVFPTWHKLIPSLGGYFLFAAGYIVYMTFVVAWMRENGVGVWVIVITWGTLGFAVMLSSFVWRRILAAHANGFPLGLSSIMTGFAVVLPFVLVGWSGLLVSAFLFGLSFFIAPTAVTTFTKKNIPRTQWGATVALYTTVFAIGQTLGPIGAGWLADVSGSLSTSLWMSALVLFAGGVLALFQRSILIDTQPQKEKTYEQTFCWCA